MSDGLKGLLKCRVKCCSSFLFQVSMCMDDLLDLPLLPAHPCPWLAFFLITEFLAQFFTYWFRLLSTSSVSFTSYCLYYIYLHLITCYSLHGCDFAFPTMPHFGNFDTLFNIIPFSKIFLTFTVIYPLNTCWYLSFVMFRPLEYIEATK